MNECTIYPLTCTVRKMVSWQQSKHRCHVVHVVWCQVTFPGKDTGNLLLVHLKISNHTLPPSSSEVLDWKKKKSTSLFPNILEQTLSIFMLPLTSLLFLYPATKCCLPTQFLLKLGWVEIHFFGSSWETSFCDQLRTPGGSAQWEISFTAPPASPLEGGSSWEVLLRNLNLWVPAEARWRTRGQPAHPGWEWGFDSF